MHFFFTHPLPILNNKALKKCFTGLFTNKLCLWEDEKNTRDEEFTFTLSQIDSNQPLSLSFGQNVSGCVCGNRRCTPSILTFTPALR